MLDRRDFIRHSVAVATLTQLGAASARPIEQSITSVHTRAIDFVLVDEEFEDSVLFANELIALGARSYSVQQDLGRLWFGELGDAFQSGSAMAGLTAHSELLICASFAQQYGARSRFEGEHDCRGDSVLTHTLRSSDPISLGQLLKNADKQWARALALELTRCTEGADHAHLQVRTSTQRSDSHPGSLFSWLLA